MTKEEKKAYLGEVFADAKSDVPFKRALGTEKYKAATIGILNAFIPEKHVVDVSFENTEVIPENSEAKNSVIDVICTDDEGTRFIVEMQRAKQENYRQRSYFYASKLIAARSGLTGDGWGYELEPLYSLSFVDFDIDGSMSSGSIEDRVLRYRMSDLRDGEKMPGSTEFVFVCVKDVTEKNPQEIDDLKEIFVYLLARVKDMTQIPEKWKEIPAVNDFLEACRQSNFSEKEQIKYLSDMMNGWDIESARKYAMKEGRAEGLVEGEARGEVRGRAEGKAEVALNLRNAGVDIATIAKASGLSEEEIRNL